MYLRNRGRHRAEVTESTAGPMLMIDKDLFLLPSQRTTPSQNFRTKLFSDVHDKMFIDSGLSSELQEGSGLLYKTLRGVLKMGTGGKCGLGGTTNIHPLPRASDTELLGPCSLS